MDVKAILVVGGAEPGESESFGDHRLALLDVLGEPLVQRAAYRLKSFGIEDIAVITDCDLASVPQISKTSIVPAQQWHFATGEELWRKCEHVFSEHAQAGAELVLVWRLGAYVEIELEEFIQSHLDYAARVTSAVNGEGALDLFAISASRRNDAAFLFRHHLRNHRSQCNEYRVRGYVNRLREIKDLRRLACDALYQHIAFKPIGKEIRPGVWAGERARIERGARILAPAYIGTGAKVRASAVLTRGVAVERHAEVDCGTVVENSSVLPFSYVGAGLDVCHSVIGFRRLAHLIRKTEVEIADRTLIGMRSMNATWRAAGTLMNVAKLVPRELVRGIFSPSKDDREKSIPESVRSLSPALNGTAAVDRSSEGKHAPAGFNLRGSAHEYSRTLQNELMMREEI